MDSQLTCGKGLTEHSKLPAMLGELTAHRSENNPSGWKMCGASSVALFRDPHVDPRVVRQRGSVRARAFSNGVD